MEATNTWLPPPEGSVCSFHYAHWRKGEGGPPLAVAMVVWPNQTQHNPGRTYFYCAQHKAGATEKYHPREAT